MLLTVSHLFLINKCCAQWMFIGVFVYVMGQDESLSLIKYFIGSAEQDVY